MPRQFSLELRDLNCMGDLKAALIEAFRSQDLSTFTHLLRQGADPEIEDASTRLSVFEFICKTPKSSAFIKECLRFNCDPTKTNESSKKKPIHYVIESADANNLRALLSSEKSSRVDINAQYSDETPLLQVASTITDTDFEQKFQLIKVLLENDADVNIADRRELTPILAILESDDLSNFNKEQLVQFLLGNCFVDLDSFRDGEAREMIATEFPSIRLPPVVRVDDRHWDVRSLTQALRNEEETLFIGGLRKLLSQQEHTDNRDNVLREAASDNNETMLQVATRYGLTSAVRALLEEGADVNYTPNGTKTPVELACFYGNWKILKSYMNEDKLNLDIASEPILSIVIRRIGEKQYRNTCDFQRCFDILLQSHKIDPNQVDKSGSSALHCAVKYKNEKAITALLEKGCYIGERNRFDDFAIMDIDRKILERHFDNCIQTNNQRPGDDELEIEFNYINLVPTRCRQDNKGCEGCQEEMPPIEYLAKCNDLKHLLQHPLIASFLFLKWHRLSLVFYLNFFIYSFFCITLTMYILFCYGHDVDPALSVCLQTFIILGILYVGLREIIQMVVSPRNYFIQKENWLEMSLIAMSLVILMYEEFMGTTRNTIASITILLAAGEFFLLLGSLPVLSFSTHLVMLKTVAASFMRSLLLYSIILFAFGLSFYTLLGGPQAKPADPDAEEDTFNTFVDPGLSMIKTVVMLTGEFDAGSINFESNSFSYILFLMFVFLISSVLFNLLNGLAVSDTQAIKSEAELLHFIHRAKLLGRYEKTMFGKNQDGCCNGILKRWASKAISMFPRFLPVNTVLVRPNDNNSIVIPVQPSTSFSSNGIGKDLFEYDLLTKAEVVSPRMLGRNKALCCLFGDKCSRMDKKIVKYTRCLLERRDKDLEEESSRNDMQKRIGQIEKNINKIMEKLEIT